MGLFDWMKPKKQELGPTPDGLYGALPKGGHWTLGPDPAGAPETFLPDSGALVFDIAEWKWGEALWIEATADFAGNLAGFGLVFGLSDGTKTDSVEIWEPGRQGPVLKSRQEWSVPHGHPTRELALVSHGEQTTQLLRKIEQCFGYTPFAHPALPEKSGVICEVLMLRGIVVPNEGRFTARMKVVLSEHDGWPYGEFFLNINSVRKQLWLSEKSEEYRIAILSRIAQPDAIK